MRGRMRGRREEGAEEEEEEKHDDDEEEEEEEEEEEKMRRSVPGRVKWIFVNVNKLNKVPYVHGYLRYLT